MGPFHTPAKYADIPIGGYLAGAAPGEIVPAILESLEKDGEVSFPYYVIDWGIFPVSNGKGEKSYRSEIRVINTVKERLTNLAFDFRSSAGFHADVVMIGDAWSCLARLASDTGNNTKSDISYPQLSEVQEAFGSQLVKFLYITDAHNAAEALTKCHPFGSAKNKQLVEMRESGSFRAPIGAFGGKMTKGAFQQKGSKGVLRT